MTVGTVPSAVAAIDVNVVVSYRAAILSHSVRFSLSLLGALSVFLYVFCSGSPATTRASDSPTLRRALRGSRSSRQGNEAENE